NFFFQAEDGIRDFHVTGVQTCALPISDKVLAAQRGTVLDDHVGAGQTHRNDQKREQGNKRCLVRGFHLVEVGDSNVVEKDKEKRSEERRVGKSVEHNSGHIKKKRSKKE